MDSEFRQMVAPDNRREPGARTVMVSVRARVWASEIDHLEALGFELCEVEPDCFVITGHNGNGAIGGDDQGQD
jgi:hypothetical protein